MNTVGHAVVVDRYLITGSNGFIVTEILDELWIN